jgi:hypothetical protein
MNAYDEDNAPLTEEESKNLEKFLTEEELEKFLTGEELKDFLDYLGEEEFKNLEKFDNDIKDIKKEFK